MKKTIFGLVAMVLGLTGCTEHQYLDESVAGMTQSETLENVTAATQDGEFSMLLQQARWGDGKAYLKLADCYREGRGVKKDLVGMVTMAAMAEEYGGIRSMDDYMESLPDGSDFKILVNAEKLIRGKVEQDAMLDSLAATGMPDAYMIQGLRVVEQGDTIGGKQLLAQAAEQGSSFAQLLLCIRDMNVNYGFDVEKLAALTDNIPFANAMLGAKYSRSSDIQPNDSLAAYYFLKADENGFLRKPDAVWLLNYYRNGGNIQLSDIELERLHKLAGEQ